MMAKCRSDGEIEMSGGGQEEKGGRGEEKKGGEEKAARERSESRPNIPTTRSL